jgi:hypothetical protein
MEIKYWGPDRYPADWEFSEISTMLWSVFFFWIPGYRHEFGYVVDHFIVTDCLFLSNINSVFSFHFRYLIDSKWFKNFKRYIGMDDTWDSFGVTDEHPGPIDNSSLFNGVCFYLYY